MDNKEKLSLRELTDEQRFQLLVNGVRDYAIYMLDPSGHVASWNAGAERFKGYQAKEIIGQHFSMFYTPQDRAAGVPARALQTALDEGKFESEGWRVRKDGSRFWASVVIDPIRDSEGNLIGYAKVTRDITDRRAMQDALRESEQRFRLLVQGVTDYAIFMLSPTGHVANWNAGAQRIKGYTESEIVGQHFSRFYTEEDRLHGVPQRALATAVETGRFEQESKRVRKDGTAFWAHVVIDAIRDERGQLLGFAKVTRDITEKRRAAEALEQANAALYQSQKMEAIGQLTGGVAHDFNNLLAVISSSLDVLSVRLKDTSDLRILDGMKRAVDRGATMTQQLLSFARKQPLKLERHNLNSLIDGFESVLRRACNSSIAFATELSPHLKAVMVDASRFETALLNLVVNARDAMPSGGKLTISTHNVYLEERGPASLPAGHYARVAVSDTGHGMPPEVTSRAFEPFFTTKERGKGTGLGLSQVYGFIVQSNGDIVLDSAVGMGTTVSIYLPALPGDDHTIAQDTESDNDTVLIVEDEPDVMAVAAELFRAIGYEVLTASTGADAIDILRRRDDIDVLFTDMIMPNGMSGIELARHAKEHFPKVKVIVASGYPMPALQAEHGNLDEFSFVNKPYRLAELAKKLRARS